MRKTITAILLALAFLLTGCGQGRMILDGDNPNVVLIISERGDMDFNDSAVVGLKSAEHDLNAVVSIVEHHNKTESFENIFLEAAQGYHHIVIMSSMMKEVLEQHAADYPDTQFLLYDGEIDRTKSDSDNVFCVVYKANEVGYLAGYLAAAMSRTGKIGFIGGAENQNIQDFALGYVEGAKHSNPNIEIQLDYAGSFVDVEKGKAIAQAMVGDGVDIIFAAAGAVGTGVLEVVTEHDCRMIGVDTDQYASFYAIGREDMASHILTSATKDISGVIYKTIENYSDLEVATEQTRALGLAEGGVALAKNDYYKATVPRTVQAEVDKIEQEIINGDIKVSSARILTPEEVDSILTSVQTESRNE